eukprot:3316790-Rhodomonas_salina.1
MGVRGAERVDGRGARRRRRRRIIIIIITIITIIIITIITISSSSSKRQWRVTWLGARVRGAGGSGGVREAGGGAAD